MGTSNGQLCQYENKMLTSYSFFDESINNVLKLETDHCNIATVQFHNEGLHGSGHSQTTATKSVYCHPTDVTSVILEDKSIFDAFLELCLNVKSKKRVQSLFSSLPKLIIRVLFIFPKNEPNTL